MKGSVLVGKPERNRLPGRSCQSWSNIIKLYLKEIECLGVDLRERVQWQALVNMVMNLITFHCPCTSQIHNSD